MKKVCFLAMALLFLASSATFAASWILPIHHRDGGGWTEYPGAGYNGTSAWGANTTDGVRRVYWSLEGSGVPTGTNLYTIRFFAPTAGGGGWQPIESQFKGVDGEGYPTEPGIPWVGAYGTNHQYIGSEYGTGDRGTWKSTGPGPHTPDSADYNAGANGIYMWLKDTSWLYAKWDYGWAIDRSWSAIEITLVPEPGSLAALGTGLLGLAGVVIRRRK